MSDIDNKDLLERLKMLRGFLASRFEVSHAVTIDITMESIGLLQNEIKILGFESLLLRSPWTSLEDGWPETGQWCVARDENLTFRSDIPPYYIFQQHPDQDCVYTHWMPISIEGDNK